MTHNTTSIHLSPLPLDDKNSKPQLPIITPSQKPLTNFNDLSYLRVAYHGIPGVISEEAAQKAYPNCKPIPCNQFEDALQAVELGIADCAVLPLENSISDPIYRNHDLLLRYDLHIIGEMVLPIRHCLLALPGVGKENITKIISNSQAFKQCDRTITKLGLRKAARKAVDNTAVAAEYISINHRRDTAAIASARSAEIYGLEMIADQIQDDFSNAMRFVVLGRDPVIPDRDRAFKTSIVLAQEISKGRSKLFEVVSAFASRNMKSTKIEVRPDPNRVIERVEDGDLRKAMEVKYMIFLDVEGSMADVRMRNALGEVEKLTSFLRVLGSYPVDLVGAHPSNP